MDILPSKFEFHPLSVSGDKEDFSSIEYVFTDRETLV